MVLGFAGLAWYCGIVLVGVIKVGYLGWFEEVLERGEWVEVVIKPG